MKKVAYTSKEVIKMLNDLSKEFQAESKDLEKEAKVFAKTGKYNEAEMSAQSAYTIDYAASRLNQLVLEIKRLSK